MRMAANNNSNNRGLQQFKSTFKRCTSFTDSSSNIKIDIDPELKSSAAATATATVLMNSQTTNSSSSREHTPSPAVNIFTPRARRYSTSFSQQLATGPRLTPRVSQLRQEECADMLNREVTHEREIHTAMQISQSWEDLTLDAESWSFKDSDLTNPLHVTLPTGPQSCSSPSPTSRTGMRLPYGLSPSPTRRTFATRRSMSPIAMRPSSLGPVKRKFELDETYGNTYSPPPFKKMFSERGNSPSLTCPSPDSIEGRTTPKLYVSKLYTNSTNSSSSLSSSPSAPSPSMEIQIDLPNEPMVTLTEECAGDGAANDIDILTQESNTDLSKRSTTTRIKETATEETKDQQVVKLIENSNKVETEFTDKNPLPVSNTKSDDTDDPSPMILEASPAESNVLNNCIVATAMAAAVDDKMIDL